MRIFVQSRFPKTREGSRRYGQHFLIDRAVLEREAEYADLGKTDSVLEIGAGDGRLTEVLAERAGKVYAVEHCPFRPELAELQRRFPNVEVRFGDALKESFPKVEKVVSNIPFRISVPLILKLLDSEFETAVLLCQKRLARRLCAGPGERGYSWLSVFVRRVAEPRYLETVKRQAFHPVPKVDSALVKLEKTEPKFEAPENFREVLDYLFFVRGWTLQRAVRSLRFFGNSERDLRECLEILRSYRTQRIYRLRPEGFGKAAAAFRDLGIRVPEIPEEAKRKAKKFENPLKALKRFRFI